MYTDPATNQGNYLNGMIKFFNKQACDPHSLLRQLKQIEKSQGRDIDDTRRNMARPIDLDIVKYDDIDISTDDLQIPHPRALERRFVLQPMVDIDPDAFLKNYGQAAELLNRLPDDDAGDLVRVSPIAPRRESGLTKEKRRFIEWGKRTYLMGILNVTPDSFSDGGRFYQISGDAKTHAAAIAQQVAEFVEHGFDIVDIGGQSTRPNASEVTTDEELNRVIPAVESVAASHPELIISVDTFNATVASEALRAGAQIINDVRAGGQPGMAEVMCDSSADGHQAICSLMHMRGDASTMHEMCTYDVVVRDVASELKQSVDKLTSGAQLFKWNVVIDPGVGFAKSAEQSIELMKGMDAFRAAAGDYPCLVGLSRKSWMAGHMTQGRGEFADKRLEQEARDWFTAGSVACMAGMSKAVDVVRVHNAKVANAVRAGDLLGRGAGQRRS